MLRIFLIIAIVGGLAATGISAYFVRNTMLKTIDERNDFQTKFNNETKAKMDALAKLKKTETELADTKTKLTQTQGELTAANGRVTDLESQNKDLATNLSRTKGERDTAQQELDKWRQIGLPTRASQKCHRRSRQNPPAARHLHRRKQGSLPQPRRLEGPLRSPRRPERNRRRAARPPGQNPRRGPQIWLRCS